MGGHLLVYTSGAAFRLARSKMLSTGREGQTSNVPRYPKEIEGCSMHQIEGPEKRLTWENTQMKECHFLCGFFSARVCSMNGTKVESPAQFSTVSHHVLGQAARLKRTGPVLVFRCLPYFASNLLSPCFGAASHQLQEREKALADFDEPWVVVVVGWVAYGVTGRRLMQGWTPGLLSVVLWNCYILLYHGHL